LYNADMELIEKIIRATERESTAAAEYYAACVVYLHTFLASRPRLSHADVRDRVETLYRWFTEPPDAAGISDASHPEDLITDLLLFGMIGKALYFLSRQSSSQFLKEATRLFQSVEQMRSNIWLFHTAGQLAQAGFDIHFIPEAKGQPIKTPDYTASRGDIRFHIEATTRSQAYTNIQDIDQLLWEILMGGDNGKALKFTDPQFDPGVIAADLSQCDLNANATGLSPRVKLQPNAFVVYPHPHSFVYDVTKDPTFFNQSNNTGNVVEYAIRYFQRLDKKKYFVRGLLIGTSMGLVVKGERVSSPKGAMMVLDHRYSSLAIPELAPAIYLVEAEPADLGQLGDA